MKPVILCILDGFGLREDTHFNAVSAAATPNLNALPLAAKVWTHGAAVGLPDGQMGSSEVGHMSLGAGRIVLPEFAKIDKALADGSAAQSSAFTSLVNALRASSGTCHVVGLLSPGGVHSHSDQITLWVQLLSANGIRTAVHIITDGRDTPPGTAQAYVAEFAAQLPENAYVATVSGRYYAMDRDNRHERTAKAYAAIVSSEGRRADNAEAAVVDAYSQGETDEFITPYIISDYQGVLNGDGLFMLNFRADRVRQLLAALIDADCTDFVRAAVPAWSSAIGAVPYGVQHVPAVVTSEQVPDTLGERVAKARLKQLRIAETEKYAHVTFFFNGGREAPFDGEDRVLIPSPKVATYDLQPSMSANCVTAAVLAALHEGRHNLIIVNYANGDMVGHSGNLAAATAAVACLDEQIGRLLPAVQAAQGTLIITADHGNAEEMLDSQGRPHTQHTLNPVPLYVCDFSGRGVTLPTADLRLCDVTGVVADLLKLH